MPSSVYHIHQDELLLPTIKAQEEFKSTKQLPLRECALRGMLLFSVLLDEPADRPQNKGQNGPNEQELHVMLKIKAVP